MTRYFTGTSGFDYDPWVGAFYPRDLKKKERLRYYTSRLSSIEINASFYRKPTLEVVQNWAAQAPDDFRFSLKGWQRVTHIQRLRDCGDLVRSFHESRRGLGDKAGAVLWQTPPNLKRDGALFDEFLALVKAAPDIKAAFEFRNDSWLCDETYAQLEKAGCALCIADTEEKSTPRVRTAPFGYFRLRREDYVPADIEGWAKQIDAMKLEDAFVYFKHEDDAKGPAYAEIFRGIIKE
jgi:uncharacterized protein YecE (DUF72 family)